MESLAKALFQPSFNPTSGKLAGEIDADMEVGIDI